MVDFKEINALMQLQGGTEAEWDLTEISVPIGVLAYAVDTKVFKLGDGNTLFRDLDEFFNLNELASVKEFKDNFPDLSGAVTGSILVVDSAGTGYEFSNLNISDFVTVAALTTALENKALATHTHNTSDITGIGSAALRDAGTAVGNVPVIGADGKFDDSIVPTVYVDTVEQDDILSYLLVAQLADDDAIKLNLPNGYADTFETEEGVDVPGSSNITYDTDKYTGTNISMLSVGETADVSPETSRLYFTCTTEAIVNSGIVAELSRDAGASWAAVLLEESRMSSGNNRIFVGDCAFDSTLANSNIDLATADVEDVKGSITTFTVDTEDTSGHFDVALSSTYSGYTLSLSGFGDVRTILITGDGTAADSVLISGTIPTGAYTVTAIKGLDADIDTVDKVFENTEEILNKGNISSKSLTDAIIINDKLYIIGGTDGTQSINEFWEYDITNNVWSHLNVGDMVFKDYYAAAAIGNIIYIHAGNIESVYYDDLWAYDTISDTWTQLASSGVLRNNHTMVAVGTKLYVYGGNNVGGYRSDLWEYETTTDTWTELTGNGVIRAEHSIAAYNNKLYVFGGYSGTYLDDLWAYDISTDTWELLISGPSSRGNAELSIINDKLYVIGGIDLNTTILNEVWRYDITAGTWTQLSDAPISRIYHTTEVYGNVIYSFGGYDTDHMNDLWSYDTASSIWKEILQVPKVTVGCTTVTYNNELYIFDGTNYDKSLWKYDPSTDTYTQLTDCSASGRRGHIAAVIGDKMYVHGGYNGSTRLADTLQYDITNDTWTTLSPVSSPPARYAHIGCAIDGKVYIHGGNDASGNSLSDTWVFDPVAITWTQLTSGPTIRENFAGVMYNNKLYVYGGFDGTNIFGGFWVYDPTLEGGTPWVQLASTPGVAHLGYMVTHGGDIYFIVGNNDVEKTGELWKYTVSTNTWVQLSSMYDPANDMSADVVDDKIYLFGNNADTQTRLSIYDITDDVWQIPNSEAEQLRIRISAMVNVDSKFYMFGGYNLSEYINNFWMYDPSIELWTRLPSGSVPARYCHTAIAYNGKIYILGGSGDTAVLNDLWAYDIATKTWAQLTPKPDPVRLHTATLVGSKMYVFGGYTGGASSSNELWAYDIIADSWVQLSSGPEERRTHSAAAIDTKIYVHGGYDNVAGYYGDTWAYDTISDTWTQLASSVSVRGAHSAMVYNNKMYIFGGHNNLVLEHDRSVYEYDPVYNLWTELDPLYIGKSGVSAAAIDNEVYIFGGYDKITTLYSFQKITIYPEVTGSSIILTEDMVNPVGFGTTGIIIQSQVALLIDGEYQIYKNLVWRSIVKEDTGIWYYKNSSNQWIAAPINSAQNAFRSAIQFTDNQMMMADLTSLAATIISEKTINAIMIKINGKDNIPNLTYINKVATTFDAGTEIKYRISTGSNIAATIKDMRIKWS